MSAADLLREAQSLPPRDTLSEHRETIEVLRAKKYSWREIAEFLSERGVDTDHTKLFRFMKQGDSQMEEQFSVPQASRYVDVLNKLKKDGKGSQQQWDMLLHHYRAHNRSASYTELGNAVGYDGDTANMHYGKFGAMIGEALEMKFARLQKEDPNSPGFMSSAIGSGSHYKNADGMFQLVMHHELAKALGHLDWFSQEDAN